MASLPPRPETTPKPRDDRRPPSDDRERDRRSALPMTASRLRTSERVPEHERSYVPRKSDSYVPPGYDSRREGDRREYDDRDRDRDRRAHGRERNRDYDRSPRRSPDRRPYGRDRPYRRSPSPYRRSGFSRRDSRSPPRYRRRSRSPPRQRPRSRSRSPRRQSPLRLGNHSIAPSPRERSPYKSSSLRNRSRSPDGRIGKSVVPPHKPSVVISAPREPEAIERNVQENSPPLSQEKFTELPSPEKKHRYNSPDFSVNHKVVSPPTTTSRPRSTVVKEEMIDVKIEKSEQAIHLPIQSDKIEDIENNMAHDMKSPIVLTTSSVSPPISSLATSLISSTASEPQRKLSHTAQTQLNWPYPPKAAARSPPRAPRGHRLVGHQTSHPIPREPRRNNILPNIPKYEKPKYMAEFESELSKYEALRRNYAISHLQEVKELQRALHELDITSIDLHAAATRHRIADLQLEKAKTGTLGIDAVDVVDI